MGGVLSYGRMGLAEPAGEQLEYLSEIYSDSFGAGGGLTVSIFYQKAYQRRPCHMPGEWTMKRGLMALETDRGTVIHSPGRCVVDDDS